MSDEFPLWVELFSNLAPSKENPEPPVGVPSVRYDHAAVSIAGNLFVTHGYKYHHYNISIGSDYRSDTWRFDVAQSKWHQLESGKIVPSPRNSLSAIVHKNTEDSTSLCIFGGDDGGTRNNSSGYAHGSFFNDLWCTVILHDDVPVQMLDWKLRGSRKYESGEPFAQPWVTSHHSAVEYHGRMYVYGGLTVPPGSTERPVDTSALWIFNFSDDSWSTIPQDQRLVPPARHSHTAVSYKGGMYIYGGSSMGKNHFSDLWKFDYDTESWTNLTTNSFPPARSWHSAEIAGDIMWVFGGGVCIKGCTLHNELWSYSMVTKQWRQHYTGYGPNSRYKHSLNMIRGEDSSKFKLCMTGGESYRPYRYYNDVWQLEFSESLYKRLSVVFGGYALLVCGVTICCIVILAFMRGRKRRQQKKDIFDVSKAD